MKLAVYPLGVTPLATEGPVQGSSSAFAFTNGHTVILDSAPAFVAGRDNVRTSISAYIRGLDSDSDQQSLFTKGHYVISETKPAFLRGLETSKGVYTLGTTPFGMEGAEVFPDSIPLWVRGHEKASTTISIFLRGLEPNNMVFPLGTTPFGMEASSGAVANSIHPFVQGWESTNIGVPYSDKVKGDNPVAYWRLGESSGTTAIDEMGAYNATYQNSPSLGQPGLVGDGNTAVTFNGSSQRALAGLPSGINGRTETIEMWVKTPTLPGKGAFVKVGHNTSGYGIGIGNTTFETTGSNLLVLFENVRWIPTGFVLASNTKYHIVLVINANGQPTVYVDGTQIYSDAGSATVVPGTEFNIGGYTASNSANRFFGGTLDEVAVYDSILSPVEIASHAERTTIVVPTQSMFIRGALPVIDSQSGFAVGHEWTTSNKHASIFSIGDMRGTTHSFVHGDRYVTDSSNRCFIEGGFISQIGIIRPYLLLSFINGVAKPGLTSGKLCYITMYDIIGEWRFDDGLDSPFSDRFDDTSTIDNDGYLYRNAQWVQGPHCEED